MIWLASFPRSGNTFFRNVLFEVYGIESSTYHKDPNRTLDDDYQKYAVVKTHELPTLLPKKYRDCPSVYIIRDGRDSLVSIAHHRKDIVVPGSDFFNNLLHSILAQKGSFFGGWSENVRQWTAKADIVIRFEDLIEDPLREIEKLRSIMDLPEPNKEKLPNFKSLKFGTPKYGGGKGTKFSSTQTKLHFRKGKIGSWKDELPPKLEKLLWSRNGSMLEKWGYEKPQIQPAKVKKKVLIEASKLYGFDNDGIKRYLTELVAGFSIILPYLPEWEVTLYDGRSMKRFDNGEENSLEKNNPGREFRGKEDEENAKNDASVFNYEHFLLSIKGTIKNTMPDGLYSRLSEYYKRGPFRKFLFNIRTNLLGIKFRKVKANFFEQLKEVDLLHIPLPQHLTDMKKTKVQKLVTVHDLTHQFFPQYHTSTNIKLANDGMKRIEDDKAHVIAVSQSTLNDVQKHYNIPSDRLHLCYEAANDVLFHPAKKKDNIDWLRKNYKIPNGRYLMCLSTIEPRKNIKNTILAFLELKKENPDWDLILLVCGKKGWKTEDVFQDTSLDHKDIIFTGFIDDFDLPYFYAHAEALCYISHYEGFGLPLLEAMYCKTPVLYGNNSSMPEVAGEGGIAVDPNNISAIKESMYEIVTNKELRKQKRKAAFHQASKFSWLKMALETLEIYDKAIANK